MAKKTKPGEEVVPPKIVKPAAGFMEKFRSKRPPSIAGVETLLTALPILRIADANDSSGCIRRKRTTGRRELCFVSVPIKGEKRDMLHLIDEEIAVQYLPVEEDQAAATGAGVEAPRRFLLLHRAVAKPGQLVERNGARRPARKPRRMWVQATSRKAEGVEGYKIELRARPGCLSRSEMAVAHA